MAAGLYVIPAGSDAWASYIDQGITALNDGWVLDQAGTDATGAFTTRATFVSATTFTLVGDQTTTYVAGRRLRIVHAGGTTYCEVLSSTFGATTTVTITNTTSGPVVATPITSVAYAHTYAGLAGNDFQIARVLNRTTTTVVASTASVTSDSTLYTFSVPAGVMGTSGILRLSMFGDFLNNSGGSITPGTKLIFGGTTILSGSTANADVTNNANRRYWKTEVVIQNVASASVQRASGVTLLGPAAASGFAIANTANVYMANGYGTAAELSTAAVTLSYVVRLASTATTVDMQLRHATLELIQ